MSINFTFDTETISQRVAPDNDRADARLLMALKMGDDDAFRQIYLRWHKPVVMLMQRITRSLQDAEDIAQDVFAHIWTNREKIDPEKNIRALIFIIARRSAVNLSRRVERFGDFLSDYDRSEPFDHDPDELFQARETQLLTQLAIHNMPTKQREVFTLYYNENMTTAQIADKLGLSQNNVQKHIYNAKKYLEGILTLMTLLFFR